MLRNFLCTAPRPVNTSTNSNEILTGESIRKRQVRRGSGIRGASGNVNYKNADDDDVDDDLGRRDENGWRDKQFLKKSASWVKRCVCAAIK